MPDSTTEFAPPQFFQPSLEPGIIDVFRASLPIPIRLGS
jgi:hypothetical protein